MGLFGNKNRKEIAEQTLELERLNALTARERGELERLRGEIESSRKEAAALSAETEKKKKELEHLEKKLLLTEDEAEMRSYGLPPVVRKHEIPLQCRAALDACRQQQKAAVKAGTAILVREFPAGQSSAGVRRTAADLQKLLLRAFNAECDEIAAHVKAGTLENAEKKVKASADSVRRLGAFMDLRISDGYLEMKLRELQLTAEYRLKKQSENEAARAGRERLRQAEKIRRESEERKRKLLSSIESLKARISSADPEAQEALKKELAEEEASLDRIEAGGMDRKAGFVYALSNEGAFGKGVVKLGMTRRPEPDAYFDELSGDAVPFDYDVLACFYSENAAEIAEALKKRFQSSSINASRKSGGFYRISPEELKQELAAYAGEGFCFNEKPFAEEMHQSMTAAPSSADEDS